MEQPVYTRIPDTTDRAYWQLKTDDATHSLQVFVPINPELHQHLRAEAWKASQSRLAKKVKPLPLWMWIKVAPFSELRLDTTSG